MKPAPFTYVRPETVEEAVAVLGEAGTDAKLLAGGQSLLAMMNMRFARPDTLVDLAGVAGLTGITVGDDGAVAIGAMTRQADVMRDPLVADAAPLVPAALRHVGHPAIRARGTFGGSVAHADPKAELPGVVLALGAELVVVGPRGRRTVAADDFFLTYYTTDLDVQDVLAEVRLPARGPSVWGFREVARRHGDFAMAGVAFAAELAADAATLASARVALFGVADVPCRCRAAEQALVGTRMGDEAAAREAAALGVDGFEFISDPHASAAYRRDVVPALIRRTVLEAAATASAAPDPREGG